MDLDVDCNDVSQQEGSKRKEKKKFKKIKTQMEFYFSDSNIMKDKFLQELINKHEDGFVDLEVFMSFNKIKAITQNVEDISIALMKSKTLQLDIDGKKICRINPLPEFKDFDSCTIYVEKLPSHADQKWLRDVFGRFGSVAHVNIPHFKGSGKIKGFAFVEFDTSESVEKACEAFQYLRSKEDEGTILKNKDKKMGKKRKNVEAVQLKKSQEIKHMETEEKIEPNAEMEELNLSDKEQAHKDEEHIHINEKFMDTEPSETDQNSLNKKFNKRKRQDSGSEETQKRIKIRQNEEQIIISTDSGTALPHPRIIQDDAKMLIHEEDDSTSKRKTNKILEKSEFSEEEALKSGGRRKRHSKNKSTSNSLNLRVMKKSEWKAYRNKFLALQRATISHLKKTILLEARNLQEIEPVVLEAEVNTETKKSSPQFIPGVIIKILLQDPIVSSTNIKSQVKAHVNVAYIDAPVSHTEAYIRCYNSEDANTIISEGKLNHLGVLEILKDGEETNYWEKLENDRKNKFSSSINHRKRGRDKIIAKAEKINEQKNKHIYFKD